MPKKSLQFCPYLSFKKKAQNENKGMPGGHSVTQRLIVLYGMGHNYSLIKYHLSKYGSQAPERRGSWSNLHARVYKCVCVGWEGASVLNIHLYKEVFYWLRRKLRFIVERPL